MRTKRVVSMVLVVLLLFGMLQLTAFATGFDDVPEYSYYYDAVYWALNQGVTAGTGASTFSPDGTLTRAQIVTFLWKLAGSPMGYQNYAAQFSDVNSSAYYFNAVGWAVYFGITSGTGSDQFSPNQTVKNKETITFMYKSVMCNQISAVSTTAGSLTNLNTPATAWYYDACIWANNHGYLASVPDFANGFLPNSNTTRALAVYLLWEMKTGNSKVYIDVYAGTGINEVTLAGRTGGHVSGYYTKGSTVPVSCTPSVGHIFEKWVENGSQIGINNPSAISANRNRTWTAIGTAPIETMVQIAINEEGNHQADNSGYNIGGHWCAAFAGWCAYSAGLASGTYTLLSDHNGSWQYFKVSQAYAGNYSNPISYPYQVLRNTSCSQQIAHFCRTGQMYVSRSVYKTNNSSTGNLDWSSATVYSTSFIPHRGDLVFFGWTSSSGYVSHVGIVTGVTKNGTTATITTIEGNTNGSGTGSDYYNSSVVGAHEYTFDMADNSKLYKSDGTLRGYIVGFGRIT